MNKRFWGAFVAVYVFCHVYGFIVHGVALNATYKSLASVFRPEAEMNSMMWLMFISSAIATFAFCYIFTKGYEGKGVAEGVRYGLWIALLAGIPAALDQFWVYPIPFNLAAAWLVTNVVYFLVGGALLAAIYRPDSAPA
jgi:hypothetical protein